MKSAISPSMMCVDFLDLQNALTTFENEGIEFLHIDIMDGVFVPNFTLGTDFCKKMKSSSRIPLDVHLMVVDPEKKISWFPVGKGDMVSVHAESTQDLAAALREVGKTGASAFVALSPDTPVETVLPVLELIDGVLIMTVYPGFAGQKMVPATLPKITEMRRLLDANGKPDLPIEVDGNVSFENAVKMRAAGADIFVTGTSAMFSPSFSLAEGIAHTRECIR